VSSADIPQPAGRSPGWFANRPLAVKFGILIGVTLLTFGGLLTAVLIGNAGVRTSAQESKVFNDAESLVLQLDTRSSELKVDGFKTLVRPQPALRESRPFH